MVSATLLLDLPTSVHIYHRELTYSQVCNSIGKVLLLIDPERIRSVAFHRCLPRPRGFGNTPVVDRGWIKKNHLFRLLPGTYLASTVYIKQNNQQTEKYRRYIPVLTAISDALFSNGLSFYTYIVK